MYVSGFVGRARLPVVLAVVGVDCLTRAVFVVLVLVVCDCTDVVLDAVLAALFHVGVLFAVAQPDTNTMPSNVFAINGIWRFMVFSPFAFTNMTKQRMWMCHGARWKMVTCGQLTVSDNGDSIDEQDCATNTLDHFLYVLY